MLASPGRHVIQILTNKNAYLPYRCAGVTVFVVWSFGVKTSHQNVSYGWKAILHQSAYTRVSMMSVYVFTAYLVVSGWKSQSQWIRSAVSLPSRWRQSHRSCSFTLVLVRSFQMWHCDCPLTWEGSLHKRNWSRWANSLKVVLNHLP